MVLNNPLPDQDVMTIRARKNSLSLQKEVDKEMSLQKKTKNKQDVMTNEKNVMTNQKTTHIQIRVSKSEKKQIKKDAEKNKFKSMSDYIRNVMTNEKDVMTNQYSKELRNDWKTLYNFMGQFMTPKNEIKKNPELLKEFKENLKEIKKIKTRIEADGK